MPLMPPLRIRHAGAPLDSARPVRIAAARWLGRNTSGKEVVV
jgi:hypothetical protein